MCHISFSACSMALLFWHVWHIHLCIFICLDVLRLTAGADLQMAWRESYSKNIHACHVCPTTTHKVRICLLAWGSFQKLISTQWKQSSYFDEISLKRRTYLGIWAHKKMRMIKSFRCFHFCTWTRHQLRSVTWLKNNLKVILCYTKRLYFRLYKTQSYPPDNQPIHLCPL